MTILLSWIPFLTREFNCKWETTHFSKYMIVDGKEWYRAWQDIYTKINESKGQHIPNALFGGDSGAQQYNLLGQEKAEWFYNKRKI